MKPNNYKIELNSLDNLQVMLQEAYDITTAQINAAQIEMNKLASSTDLTSELVENKVKYSKAMHDFMGDKDRAISRRIEIAKLMSDIIKQNGNVTKALEDNQVSEKPLDLEELKAQLKNNYSSKSIY